MTMNSVTDLLDSPVRRRIVDTLANLNPDATRAVPDEGITAQHLAAELGLHVTTVRFHLDQLVAAGLLVAHFQRRKTAGRPRKLYAIERGSLETVPNETSYRMLSQLLVESFRLDEHGNSLSPEEAGARWGRQHAFNGDTSRAEQPPAQTAGQWLGKIGQAVDLLHEWGYTPEVSTAEGGRGAMITLYECPFLELAHENTPVVCGIHRGLLRGVMEAIGEPDVTVGLQPFVTPTSCIAAVTTAHPFTGPGSPAHHSDTYGSHPFDAHLHTTPVDAPLAAVPTDRESPSEQGDLS